MISRMAVFQIIQAWNVWFLVLVFSISSSGASLLKPAVVYTSQHTALISWSDPSKDHGDYVVEYGTDWKHSKKLQISKTTNTAMIHGLEHDTLYRVRLMATNAIPGPSLWFRTKPYAVSFGTPAVSLEPLVNNQLLVNWRLPPGVMPSDVVHFSLIYCPLYSPFFMKTSLILPGNYRKFTLKFLRPNTVYKVKLATLFKTRKGPYSTWVMEKTQEGKGQITRTTETPALGRTQDITTSIIGPTTFTQKDTHQTHNKTAKTVTYPVQHTTYDQQPTMTVGTSPSTLRMTVHTTSNQNTKTTSTQEIITIQSTGRPTNRKEPAFPKTQQPSLSGNRPTISDVQGNCERIIPGSMCSDNGYDTTKVLYKGNQQEMLKHVKSMWSIVSSKCLDLVNLKRFMCAANFPYCSLTQDAPILPCRSMCTITKRRCNLMYDDIWPTEMDCDNFPDVGEGMCVSYGILDEPTDAREVPVTTSAHNIISSTASTDPMAKLEEKPTHASGEAQTVEASSATARKTSATAAKRAIIGSEAISNEFGNVEELSTTDVPLSSSLPTSGSLKESSSPYSSAESPPITNPSTPNAPSTSSRIDSSINAQTKPPLPSQSTTSSLIPSNKTLAVRPSLSGRCEPLKLSMCDSAGYKWVQLPNFFNHTHQHDADRAIVHYWPLVEVQCSPYFTHFLCSLFTPICTDTLPSGHGTIKGNILPCRSLCEKVTRQCGLLMKVYEYTWPEGVSCDKFPEDGKETCFYPNTDFVKFAELPSTEVQSTDVTPGTNGCHELSFDHICKKHYTMARLSNMSKSFQSVNTAINNRMSIFGNKATKKCLRNLELFMCSLYVPRCSKDYKQLGPCRSQCKTTFRRCRGVLKDIIAFLPELDNCRQFPFTGCTANRHRAGKYGEARKSSIETQ